MLLLLMVAEGRDTGLTCKSLGQVWCVSAILQGLPLITALLQGGRPLFWRGSLPTFVLEICFQCWWKPALPCVQALSCWVDSEALCCSISWFQLWDLLGSFYCSCTGNWFACKSASQYGSRTTLYSLVLAMDCCQNDLFLPSPEMLTVLPCQYKQFLQSQSKRFWEQTFKWPLLLAWISDDRTRLCILIKTCPKFCGCEWFCWHQLETTCAWSLASAGVLCWIRAIVTIWHLLTKFVKKSTC